VFRTICDLIPNDRDFPARTRRLEIFKRVLDGTIYDVLNFEFYEERTAGGEYIPLRHRRPSVKYALARVVVEDPTVDSPDHKVRDTLIALTRNCHLNSVMTEAALRGSIGSAAILLRLLGGRIHLLVLDASHLFPIWQPDAPDTL
jgi:hypothetical protein